MNDLAQWFDLILAITVLCTALLALFVPDRTTSVILFLTFGLLLAIAWARLGAPDVALAEAVLGAGVTGALLLDAVHQSSRPVPSDSESANSGASAQQRSIADSNSRPTARWRIVDSIAAASTIVMLGVLGAVMLAIGPSSVDIATEVNRTLDQSGVAHPITAVLLNFRSFDTLMEIAVLVAAAVGAVALSVGSATHSQSNSHASEQQVPAVLTSLLQVLAPILVLLIGWLLLAGTTRPGGAFQGGAVLAAALILAFLVRHRSRSVSQKSISYVLVSGLVVFVAAAVFTASVGSGWLVFDAAWAGGVILAIEVALTFSIGVALAAIFVANRGSVR